MEELLAGTWQNGVIYDPMQDGCELRINGECVLWHKLAVVCEREAVRRGIVLEEATAPAVAPVMAQDAPKVVEPVKVSKPRCPHYKAIRRAFAIATELGLDTKADEAMRAAFGRCLHKEVASREVLNSRDWLLLGDAMKARQLAW
jgi:hypothetical protein